MTMGSASEARSATVSIPELAGCSGLEFVVRSPLALFSVLSTRCPLLGTITMSCSQLVRSKTIFPGAWPVRLRSIADARSSKPTTSAIVDRSEPSAIS
jgi:hypothetical protein